MLSTVLDLYALTTKWSNDNQGVVSIVIFVITIVFGWTSGIFSAFRRRPKFRLSLIDGPTFCCTFPVGKEHKQFKVHRTGIALYLVVANVGSAPSSIENISVGYHWQLRRYSWLWLKYSVGWFWLANQTAALADFQAKIGTSVKIYPFLTQKNQLSTAKSDTYLEIGRSVNGVVYFEQSESWGGFFPAVHKGSVRMKVRVRDVFGKAHTATFAVPSVSFEDARKYNPAFAKTLAEIQGEVLPFDRSA